MKSRILIYESQYGGHRTEFVEYMLDYLATTSGTAEVFFLIDSKIYSSLQNTIEKAEKNNQLLRVQKINKEDEAILENAPSQFKRALREKEILSAFFEKHGISQLVLLELDPYQYVLGTWANSKFSNIQVNGILFNPYIQDIAQGNNDSIKSKFRLLRKKFQLKWILRNKGINSIFVLNDHPGVEKLNNIMGTSSNFRHLPDPLKIRPYKKIDIRGRYGIAKDKKILLAVGGVQRRKNIIAIINGVEALEDELASQSCLLILGKCFDDKLLEQINTLIANCNKCQIVFENKLLNDDEFESAVEEAYLMFTIYRDFFSSSGIVNHAAKHGKCTIASENGVIGYVTKKYNLGVTVDPYSNSEIAEAIQRCLKEENLDRYNNDFVEERHFKNFAKALLEFN